MYNSISELTKGNDKLPSARIYGTGETGEDVIASINFIRVLHDASSAGRMVISLISDAIDNTDSEDYIVPVQTSVLTAYEKSKWRKGYKEISEAGLVTKVGELLFLNPIMVVPADYSNSIEIWNTHVVEEFRVASPVIPRTTYTIVLTSVLVILIVVSVVASVKFFTDTFL